MALLGFSGGFFSLSNPIEPKNEATVVVDSKGTIGFVLQKNFFLPLPSPRKLNKTGFTNAFRPDFPSRKFREQQHYSENSENSEYPEYPENSEKLATAR